MPLEPAMGLGQIRSYLDGDLRKSIRDDIGPSIQARQGGYFGVTRAVLCYVDYLGGLYGGWEGKVNSRTGAKEIATTKKAIAFIKDVLGDVDAAYRQNGALLYKMYRHGTVHLYAPRDLRRKDERVLSWLPYRGDRGQWLSVPRAHKVRHLNPIRGDDDSDWLPVSITCLYHDLLASLDVLFGKVQRDSELLTRWHCACAGLLDPDPTSLEWST